MIELILWFFAASILWVLGWIGSVRSPGRSAFWPLLGNFGFGLCCVFLGMTTLNHAPLGHPFWTRLLWSTLLLTVPSWVAFSQRFARPEGSESGQLQRLLLALLWISAVVLLVLGYVNEPLESIRTPEGRMILALLPPLGQWIVLHTLLGVMLLLWNLQATLEAARVTSRRRTSQAIYSLLPLVMTSLYVLAELLLYRQQRETTTEMLLAAILISGVAFSVIVMRGKRSDFALPVGHQITLSSVVLTALGAFFVGLALLVELLRRFGLTTESGWPERVIVGLLAILLSFWIFPGMREELRRFLDRRVRVAEPAASKMRTCIEELLHAVDRMEDLLVVLRILLQDRFGDLRLDLWAFEPMAGEFAPVGISELPRLGPSHPLIRAMDRRSQPLLLAGDASRIEDVPLHVACEEIAAEHCLRVFLPIRGRGDLVAVLACGPGGGRTIHPEDIDLLRRIADRLGDRVTHLAYDDLDRRTFNRRMGEAVEIKSWLTRMVGKIEGSEEARSGICFDYRGPERVVLSRSQFEPLIIAMLRDALDHYRRGGRPVALAVRIVSPKRICFEVGPGLWKVSLRLPDSGENEGNGEGDAEGCPIRPS